MTRSLTLLLLWWLFPCCVFSQNTARPDFAKERDNARTFYQGCIKIYGSATTDPNPDNAPPSENNSYCLTQYRAMVADIDTREKQWDRTHSGTNTPAKTTGPSRTTPLVTTVNNAGGNRDEVTLADGRKGFWITKDITIRHQDIYNAPLYPFGVTAFTCDDDGNPWHNGLCVNIDNHSQDTIFYRSSLNAHDKYVPIKTQQVIDWTPANVMTFYPILPGQHRILCFDGYLSKKEKTLSFDMHAQFLLFRENKKPGAKTSQPPPPPPPASVVTRPPAKPAPPVRVASTFYILLQANIRPPAGKGQFDALKSPALEIVFSTPQKHTGFTDDDLTALKEAFVQAIVDHYRGVEFGYDLGKILRDNNYEPIKVLLTPPYVSRLLRTPEEAQQAAERWKDLSKQTVGGLGRLSFIQIEIEKK